jgi:hypothetical protein
MLTSVAAVTTKVTGLLVMPPSAALICVEPEFMPVARPWWPALLSMVAMLEGCADQVTWLVMSWFELSLNVPVAVNCWVEPLAMVGVAGVIAMPVSVALVTVNVVAELVMPFSEAEIIVVPAALPVI